MPFQQNRQRPTILCSRAVLFASSVAFAVLLALRLSEWREKYSAIGTLGLTVVFFAVVSILAYMAIRGRSRAVQRIAAEMAALALVFLAVEAAIVVWIPDAKDRQEVRRRAADRARLPFDARSVSEVVGDLRREGVDALPHLTAAWPRRPEVRPHLPADMYPLSHARNVVVVECNESGRYHSYRTDEWGFNNPPGLVASGDVDVALVGESYMLGHCLPESQSVAARIRSRYPRTANFAMAGNRTLTQLGSFREYVEQIKPRIVLWAVNPDFVVAEQELGDPVLARYLEPEFSQGLLERQDEIDRLVRTLAPPVQAELDWRAEHDAEQARLERWQRVWRLPEIRSHLGRFVERRYPTDEGADLTVFVRSLHLARQAAERWRGQLVVVLLPTYAETVADQITGTVRHDHLAQVVNGLDIPVVDGVALFQRQPDPAGLFTLRINNHPTAEGYALLADGILAEFDTHFPSSPGNEVIDDG